MTQIEILSQSNPADFTDVWYDLAENDHFWMRARFDFFLREARRCGLDTTKPLRGLDIGCGHGAVQRQLLAQTAWRADGCDLNQSALARRADRGGRVLYYDINDRRPELREAYDYLVLFDVIEHIAETKPFIEAATFHLKSGGYVFVNVPACQRLFSRYDTAAGHHRRYDKKMLRAELAAAGLRLCVLNYWGALLLPALIARNLYISSKHDAADIIRSGFHPPGRWAGALLQAAITCERLLPRFPLGTSLLAIARKP